MKSKPIRFSVMLSLIFWVIYPAIYAQTNIQDFDPNKQLDADSPQPAPAAEPGAPIRIYHDPNEAAIVFAAQDLQKVLISKGHNPVTLQSIANLPPSPEPRYIVIAKDNSLAVLYQLQNRCGKSTGNMGVQDYALRITDNSGNLGYWAIGGDRVGAMYGGINIAEIVAAGSLADMKNEDQSPFIAKRGLKFNIPLDDRQPSFDDTGTAARENVKHMWDWAFWEEYLDQLARQRYNVLSLWNRHPFPTLVRLDDYPDVALDDVYDKSGNLIKEMDHSEKIDFWRKIMDYAYDRGIEIYWFVWNIELLPIVPRDLNDEGEFDIGAYGISRHPDNQITIDYIRQSTKALFRTYPRLAGLGITSGEKMHWAINGKEVRMEQAEKEDWLWDSYGKGVMDFKQEHPERKVHFIHRYWLTDYDAMESHFSRLPDGYDLSYKYVKARLYSTTKPPWLWDDFLENLPAVESKSTWWNLRNDDIYILRWGDPDYVRQFILNFPTGRLTAGYYMGSDRHCWGRESFSKNPQFPRQLENEKHWYKFLLWGRLGYDPDTPTDLLKGLIKNRFPNVDANALYNAWQSASRVIPLVNQFHWLSWDYMWWVEACISSGFGNTVDGFHTVNDFIDNKTMEGSGLTTIPDFVNGDNSGISPLQVADNLEQYAKTALATLTGMTDGGNQELRETLGDIRAQAHLGAYYAHKIRGAVELQRFREFNGRKHKAAAVKHLENALIEWRRYANVLDTQYNTMRMPSHGWFDWWALEKDVQNDISIAQNAE